MTQHDPRHQVVQVITLRVRSCHCFKAQRMFYNVHNTGCFEPLLVSVLERDGKIKGYLHKARKRDVTVHISGHRMFKLAPLSRFVLADYHSIFLNDQAKQDMLLNPTYAAFRLQLSHRLQTMMSNQRKTFARPFRICGTAIMPPMEYVVTLSAFTPN